MARQPIDQALQKRHPISRQAIWQAIRSKPEGFFYTDLERATRINRATIRSYVEALRAGGYVDAEPAAKFAPVLFRLVRDVGHEAPRLRPDGAPVTQGASREQMWRTMKIALQFTAADLAVQASVPGSVVSDVDAKDYCKRLAAAGYLAVISKGRAAGRNGTVPSVYRFVRSRDTGPLPPMVQRLKSVFDPNLNQVVWQEEPRA
ncbi:hypothetical protein [Mesorhizobium sp. KR1-2]|uniref:hypothetical protein n=1 Tax=Mesorhizobium sp. KR1-2 TaxID=3156609 RepID=UPI0032B539E7